MKMSCEQCLSYEVCQFKPVDRPHECKYWKDNAEFVSNKNIYENMCAYIHEYFVRSPNGEIICFSEHSHCPIRIYSNDDEFIECWETRGKGFASYILHHDMRPIEKMIKDFKPYRMRTSSFKRYLKKIGCSIA